MHLLLTRRSPNDKGAVAAMSKRRGAPISTQRLQHALSQVLNRLRHEHDQLDATIATLEAHLGCGLPGVSNAFDAEAGREPHGASAGPPRRPKPAGSGGRSSAGWTDDARAAVAARMRAYWQARREQAARAKQLAAAQAMSPGAAAVSGQGDACHKASKGPSSRSTVGWTDQARAEAASRMRARWQARRSAALGRA